jgi:hypothetical protein
MRSMNYGRGPGGAPRARGAPGSLASTVDPPRRPAYRETAKEGGDECRCRRRLCGKRSDGGVCPRRYASRRLYLQGRHGPRRPRLPTLRRRAPAGRRRPARSTSRRPLCPSPAPCP